MPKIPRDDAMDSTIPLLREGYTFISNRCDALQSDIFQTRLMLKNAFCIRGEAAAEMFYHQDRFTRNGAMPPTTVRLLQDKGSVQLEDGDSHRYRKAMFMTMMSPEQIRRLVDIVDGEWNVRLQHWTTGRQVVLFDEMQEMLCRAACRWAGIPPLSNGDAKQRTREFGAMIDYAGTVDPRNWWAQRLRQRTEEWARDIIQHVRSGVLEAVPDSPLSIIATHRDSNGRPLDVDIAAVELINILRPTVAVARYIVFVAVALYHYPAYRSYVQHGDDGDVEYFVHEVRRFYPFFPFIGGKVREPFEWQGHTFTMDTWVILDLYGTNHDPRIWKAPQVFRPERFRDWDSSAFNFIPQGAGDHHSTHRCPGEWITIALMEHAARYLADRIDYDVPAQDLTIRLTHMPARPKSGFVMASVRGIG